ncbi:MAG: FGGY-family carbohydrate kinase, partial [Fervidobacterium pennivorans]
GIVYALLEGKMKIEKKTGVRMEKIGLSGGGSKSDEVCQITTNILGVPTYKVQTNETASLGAAIAGYVGIGKYRTFEEAVQNMVRIEKIFYPDTDKNRLYMEYFGKVYTKMWKHMEKLYHELGKITVKTSSTQPEL